MRVRRLFVTEEELSPEGVVFSKSHSHYLLRVLRLKPGDLVEVLDGRHRSLVKLSYPVEGILRGTIVESHPVEDTSDPRITLAFACVRPGPTEDILQHCTELGVKKFVPILTQRAARRPRDIKDRWLSIVAGAAAQSRQSRVPELSPPVSLADFLSSYDDASAGLLLSPDRNAVPILECLHTHAAGEVVILVGPEGGFETSEECDAVKAGFTRVSLGAGVLRSETAAIVAASSVGMWRQWRAFQKDQHIGARRGAFRGRRFIPGCYHFELIDGRVASCYFSSWQHGNGAAGRWGSYPALVRHIRAMSLTSATRER